MLLQRLTISIFAFLLVTKSFSQADGYFFSRLDISNGLSNNQVNCFYRDQKGFLWVGTLSGLNRYDGYQVKTFRHELQNEHSLSENMISRILEGPHQQLWIETRIAFNLLDLTTEKIARDVAERLRSMKIEGTVVSDIRKRRAGTYWFLMDKQVLWEYNEEQKMARVIRKTMNGNSIAAFQFDKKGDCYIMYTSGMLEVLNVEESRIIATSNIPAKIFDNTAGVFYIFIDSDNELWIHSQTNNPKGVLRLNPFTNVYSLLEKDKGAVRLNTNIVASVVQDNKGDIWIGTDHGGVNIYNKRTNTIQYILHDEEETKSLGQNSIVSIYKDEKGFIWIGTFKKGVSYYHESIINLPLYKHRTTGAGSLSYDDVNRFAEDAKGNIWVGTNGGGLNYFDRSANKFIPHTYSPVKNAISNNVVVSLCIDRQQKLWIGSYYGGLDCYDGKTFTNYRHNPGDSNSLADDRVWEIMEDSKGQLWIGTLGNGLNVLDKERKKFRHYKPFAPGSIQSYYVAALMEDKEGRIWVGTSDGLNIINKDETFVYIQNRKDDLSSLSNNNVTAIVQDRRGLVWVGTYDGLNVYSDVGKKKVTLHTKDGMPHNTVLTMVEDNEGRIWVGTPNGLSCITTRIENDGSLACHFLNYDEADGLQGREFNENAVLRTSKGELLFGGANGFNMFVPPVTATNTFKGSVALTGFQVFNKMIAVGEKVTNHVILPVSITYTDKLVLKHNENVFSVEFAAMDFYNAEKIRYAYMLEGFNKEWLFTDALDRKATFTNLDPGTYQFKVKAIDANGNWSEETESLTIKVLPPFWKTPLAYILYAVVLAGVLYFFRKMELKRTRKKFEIEEEKKEARRKHELDVMKIRFFTNVSHEFRTPLSLILAPLDKMTRQTQDASQQEQLTLLKRNAKRLLNLVNQLLDFRKMEEKELGLAKVQGDIIVFLHDIANAFTDIADSKHISFSIQSNVSSFTTSFDQEKVERILFNLLSNAFKFTPSNGHVAVTLLLQQESGQKKHNLSIMIRDTGIGIEPDKTEKIFERFFQNDIPGSIVNQGSGIGLAITREFVKLHGGAIHVESEPNKGSNFIVNLPLLEEEVVVPAEPMPQQAKMLAVDEPFVERQVQNGRALHKLPLVLLIEDNDDFRFYLKDNLREHFTIIEAANGKTGWQKALAAHPDLIVSDISMPEMNGIELCQKIKKDSRTSHIPVILLTAISGEEQQLRGLETGASDYMTKPFNFEILLNRIKNNLSQHQALKKTYQKQVEIKQGEIPVESSTDRFLQQVLAEVEKNISNGDFTVEDLSRTLCMSRVALYKRMLNVTGKSPLEFIKNMRMQKAAQLLDKTELTIAEIAYEVGFNNPKHFSKSFKAVFTMLPTSYRQQKNR